MEETISILVAIPVSFSKRLGEFSGRFSASDIVVLAPYRAQAVGIAAFLASRGVIGVRSTTIHSFNGNECDHVIVSLTGGTSFLDQERLIHSIMTRSKKKLYLILSRFYENVPPDHALARFLHSCCVGINRSRHSVS